jgi:hypothetical protein
MESLVAMMEGLDPAYPAALTIAALGIWMVRRASRRSANRRTLS